MTTEETWEDRQKSRDVGAQEDSLQEVFVLEAQACFELVGSIVELKRVP